MSTKNGGEQLPPDSRYGHEGELEMRNRLPSSYLWDEHTLDGMIRDSIFPGMARFIEAQNFFFIATADTEGHCDASFRGTEVNRETGMMLPTCKVLDHGQTLVFPDYSGNGLYNSLGNILVNPHIGIIFIDFIRIGRVRINGKAFIEAVNEDIRAIWPRAQAYVRVVVEHAYGNCPARIPRLVPG